MTVTSLFLQLPVELVLDITDYLPLHSQAVVSQTCRHMQNIAVSRLQNSLLKLHHVPRTNYRREYLALIVRDIPNKWLCEFCIRLHPVDFEDNPTRQGHCRCNVKSAWPNYLGTIQNYFELGHRHVQLALKYTRLETIGELNRQYLAQLMAPYHRSFRAIYEKRTAQFSLYPKVKLGRYLVKAVWEYEKEEEEGEANPETIWRLDICQHQGYEWYYENPRRINWRKAKLNDPHWALQNAMSEAFRNRDVEIHGCCSFCRTDFSVRITSERATISAWKDMGSECSPEHISWTSQADKIGIVFYNGEAAVRTLYESEPDDLSSALQIVASLRSKEDMFAGITSLHVEYGLFLNN